MNAPPLVNSTYFAKIIDAARVTTNYYADLCACLDLFVHEQSIVGNANGNLPWLPHIPHDALESVLNSSQYLAQ